MSRNLVRPFFPIPPQEYDQTYFDEVIRSFAVYLDQMQNPGEGRNTALVLTNLQNDDQGLEVGSLFPIQRCRRDHGANKNSRCKSNQIYAATLLQAL